VCAKTGATRLRVLLAPARLDRIGPNTFSHKRITEPTAMTAHPVDENHRSAHDTSAPAQRTVAAAPADATTRGLEVKARASEAWLAAAEKLLSDVRGELGNLVGSPTVATRAGEPTARRGRVGSRVRVDRSADQNEAELSAEEEALQALDAGSDDVAGFEASIGEPLSLDGEERGAARLAGGRVESSLDAYLRQLTRLKPFTREEEQEMVRAAQAGHPEAINQLVSRSLRIVPPIARTFVGRGLPLEDLIEEGNLGLYRAVPRFDLSLGHRFSTYARWWVKNEIGTAVLNQGRLIRLPVNVFRALSRVRRQLESVGRGMPYVEQASDRRGVEAGADEATRFTLVEAQALLRLTELPLSLDMPVEGAEAEMPLVDTLAGEVDDSPETRIQQEQRARLLSSAVERLSPNEREVVMRRYGFASGEPETLEAIGKSLALTAERVRQIQKAALLAIQQDFALRGLSLDELL
jgi:RNA polymerase nonessential primary-like sigma factor